ncbi:MAG: hypothetical protein BWX50_00832 [Euryarchaeota archaeon ADurb.Bin009]|nr:MAG: hypothetical protein BWX50_00832 [Euryarchaeota archaeon ADurb.Bin009]
MTRKMMIVVTRASTSVPKYSRKFAPDVPMANRRGKNPIGKGSVPVCQFRNPFTRPCETPATMKSPTPEPTPHLVTTSSISTTRRPPMQSWRKIKSETANIFPPKNCVATDGSGIIIPLRTMGSASTMIITKMSIFCRPMYMTWPRASLVSICRIPAPLSSCSTIDAVTIGPIPRCRSEPLAPASRARYIPKISCDCGESPKILMLVNVK